MTDAAKKILDSLDSLPESDRDEVYREVLRRAAHAEHDSPSDDDLLASAEELFLELDHRESQ